MAGLGECCSHVAATLFYMDTATKIVKAQTCTSIPCAWLKPSASKIEYSRIAGIDFTSPVTKRKARDADMCETGRKPKSGRSYRPTPPSTGPTEEERSIFYEKLYKTGVRAVVLSVVEKYSDAFFPQPSMPDLPQCLDSLFEKDNLQLDLTDLLRKSYEVMDHMCITKEQVNSEIFCTISKSYNV